jgi:hypothetical protein
MVSDQDTFWRVRVGGEAPSRQPRVTLRRAIAINQVTWAPKAPSFNMRVRHKEADYEEVKVYGRADHRGSVGA